MFRYVAIVGLISFGYADDCLYFNHKLTIPLDPECAQQTGVTTDDYESINTIDGLYLLMQGRQMDYALCLADKNNLITGNRLLHKKLCLENFERAIDDYNKFFNKDFLNAVKPCYSLDGDNALICLLDVLIPWVTKNYQYLERREERMDKHLGIDPNAGLSKADFKIGEDGLSPHDREEIIWYTMNLFHEILHGMTPFQLFSKYFVHNSTKV